jgi:hypothetical protein
VVFFGDPMAGVFQQDSVRAGVAGRAALWAVSLEERSDPRGDVVSDSSEDAYALIMRALGGCGVLDGPMFAERWAGKDGTGVPGAVADGDDVTEVLPEEAGNILRALAGDVHAGFTHSFDGE